MSGTLEVRPFSSPLEYDGMLEYFYSGSPEFLRGMGIDPARLPSRKLWRDDLLADHERSDAEKDRLYLAWRVDGALVGHSSMNCIRIGTDGFLHLHLWKKDLRGGGVGTELVRLSAELYRKRLNLPLVYSEPYARNPAPNAVFRKLGWTLTRSYVTTPGKICFEQEVNRWEKKVSDTFG